MWKSIHRTEFGYASNRRTVKLEADKAYAIRDLAISNTDQTNQVLLSMANMAAEHLTVDVAELSWLANALNLSIRCTIDEEARMFIF